MDLRIEKLLEKYWKGETSVAEEKAIREHFRQHPDLSMEGQYFRKSNSNRAIAQLREFKHPGRIRKRIWISIAAAVSIGLLSLPFVIQRETTRDQFAIKDSKEAYEITKKALLMVSEGLNEGRVYTRELTKFNEAEEKIKKVNR